MVTSHRLMILPVALALSSVALAEDPDKATSQGEDTPAVQTLKSSLPSTSGFKVDSVREGSDGVSCITYRVSNEMGSVSKAHAVVDGEKVLRSSARSKDFEKAWNSKCVAAK